MDPDCRCLASLHFRGTRPLTDIQGAPLRVHFIVHLIGALIPIFSDFASEFTYYTKARSCLTVDACDFLLLINSDLKTVAVFRFLQLDK